MIEVSVHEAKAHFASILNRVEAGESLVITRHNKPIAELKPIAAMRGPIRLGAFEGELDIPDDAFAPLSEEELQDWYGI